MRWEPSVRTRHLAVLLCLIILVTGVLLLFNTTRSLQTELRSRGSLIESLLLEQLFQLSQRAIFNRPLEDPKAAIGLDETVRSLIQSSTDGKSEVVYSAIVLLDGEVIVQSDPRGVFPAGPRDESRLPLFKSPGASPPRIRSYSRLVGASWTTQLWQIFQSDAVYEIGIPLSLGGSPYAQVVAGVSTESIRQQLSPTLQLSLLFSLIMILLALLVAMLSSNLVLWPLREVMQSIEQLEVASAMHGGSKGEAGDMQSLTQRLQELGRRFAGNRSEVETIRDQMQLVVRNLSERILLLDREQRVLLASPEAERLLGREAGQLRGRPLADSFPAAHPLVRLTREAFQRCQSIKQVVALPVPGEEGPQPVHISWQLFEERGKAAGALVTLRDFATLQQLETQLDFATKLGALNRITAGVAHEVKNPLHAMVLHLELLKAKLEAGQDPNSHIEILTTEVMRLTRVVQTFLDFTRPVELKPMELDANALVREVVLLAADARAKGIDIVEEYGEGPLQIKGDSDLLKQALLNIVINGCQAMPDGGQLRVRTERENGHVRITVSDQGPGISPEAREKIFNLYYTTKPKGSGIGLAQVFRAVQLHNGQIHVDSKSGQGASFQLSLPKA
ncbi:MAG: sensor histidine kinase [Blastocatellia bacterium]